MYESLVGLIIDKDDKRFEDFPKHLDGYVFIGFDNGFIAKENIDIQSVISDAIQSMLDTKAQEYRYDDMKSVRSYAGFPNPFQTECINLATWGANCWVVAGQIEADVKSGIRPMSTVEEVLGEMPTL